MHIDIIAVAYVPSTSRAAYNVVICKYN